MDELKQITEFGTSGAIVTELKKHGTIKKMKQGDILLQEHAFISSIPIILQGSIGVYQTGDDMREMLLYYLKAGETCIMSVFGAMYREMSKVKAVANEDSEVLLVPVDKLGYLAKEHPEWINYIFRVYHQRFQELLDLVNAVAFKKMDERLLNFIQRKTEIGRSPVIRITHEELSNELGTARVVVSRLLKQMENDGLIELGRNQITLL
ncbi:MAG: Crp/Fnr family transcriptional regulator [Cyclonatronaceae bacterium]